MQLARRIHLGSLAAAALLMLSVAPASAQISNGPSFGVSPGNAYRNNLAYDPINQVYLMIVQRPPVTGRWYNKNGVQIGPDFVIASEPAWSAWATVTFGGPAHDPTFLVTYILAEGLNPKYGRLVRYVQGGGSNVTGASWITDVTSEWIYAEKAQSVWTGQRFVVGSRFMPAGGSFPSFQVNHFEMNGWVSPGVDLGDGQDYYGSPAISCAAGGVCLTIGYMAGIPSGYTGGTYGRRFDGGTLQPLGGQFTLSSGAPNEDQGVVYQAHKDRFLTQWFRGGGLGYIDTRLVGTDGWMSTLDLGRGIGPEAGTNIAAYNPSTQTTLLLTKSVGATLFAIELGDDGYPRDPNNWLIQTYWDGRVLDYLPSIAANPIDGQWLITWELHVGGFARLIHGNGAGGTPPPSNPVQNGDFGNGLAGWTALGTPSPNDIVANVNGGVLEFYRQPGGGTNAAVVLQPLNVGVGANTSITAQFDLGNSSSVKKRLTVLFHDLDFSDLQFCTFWLEPGAPLRTFVVRTYTTEAWANATVSFYAATEGHNGGAYRLDKVSVSLSAGYATDRTECVDPMTPSQPGGGDGPEMIGNGNFSVFLFGWQLHGQISSQVSGGVFQFVRPSGSPAGSLLQATGVATGVDSAMTATFDLGNSSAVRKRVTVLVHDLDYSFVQGCSFWLNPGQPLTPYRLRTFAGKTLANTSISFFLGSVDTNEWARIDNVSLKRTPSVTITGTDCALNSGGGGSSAALAPESAETATGEIVASAAASPSSRLPARSRTPVMQDAERVSLDVSEWVAAGTFAPLFGGDIGALVWASSATSDEVDRLTWNAPVDLRAAGSARLQFLSHRTSAAGSADVQVSLDGLTWATLGEVAASDGWNLVDVDLSDYIGQLVYVRFVHVADQFAPPSEWYLSRVSVLFGSLPRH